MHISLSCPRARGRARSWEISLFCQFAPRVQQQTRFSFATPCFAVYHLSSVTAYLLPPPLLKHAHDREPYVTECVYVFNIHWRSAVVLKTLWSSCLQITSRAVYNPLQNLDVTTLNRIGEYYSDTLELELENAVHWSRRLVCTINIYLYAHRPRRTDTQRGRCSLTEYYNAIYCR